MRTVSGDYLAVDDFGGMRHLGVWPLADAAQSCFGSPSWPADVPIPQAIEFEVAEADEVTDAATELQSAGYSLIHGTPHRTVGAGHPRLLGPEGLLIGICFCPWMHEAT